MAGGQGSAATRGGIPLYPPLLPTLAWDPGTLPQAEVDCLSARMPPPFLAGQPAGGLQGRLGRNRQARWRGLECALSRWQPVQDTHRVGKALIDLLWLGFHSLVALSGFGVLPHPSSLGTT